jgi:hypothetical protein
LLPRLAPNLVSGLGLWFMAYFLSPYPSFMDTVCCVDCITITIAR